MTDSLVGKQVILLANDFVIQDLPATIVIVDIDNNKLLLELDIPLEHANTTFLHIVALPRLSRDDLSVLVGVGVLGCSVTWVPEEKYDPNNPFDLSWWRGGGAAITDLCINYYKSSCA